MSLPAETREVGDGRLSWRELGDSRLTRRDFSSFRMKSMTLLQVVRYGSNIQRIEGARQLQVQMEGARFQTAV